MSTDFTIDKFNRCVLVMDQNLEGGYLANAISVISLTVGQRHPYLVGDKLVDKNEIVYPGLIPTGIPMLCAPKDDLNKLRNEAIHKGCDVICFPVIGQKTKNYEEFKKNMAVLITEDIQYTGIAIIGDKKNVSKIVKNLNLIR